MLFRHADEFSEPARIEIRLLELRTHGDIAVPTVMALAAGNVMRHNHTIADANFAFSDSTTLPATSWPRTTGCSSARKRILCTSEKQTPQAATCRRTSPSKRRPGNLPQLRLMILGNERLHGEGTLVECSREVMGKRYGSRVAVAVVGDRRAARITLDRASAAEDGRQLQQRGMIASVPFGGGDAFGADVMRGGFCIAVRQPIQSE